MFFFPYVNSVEQLEEELKGRAEAREKIRHHFNGMGIDIDEVPLPTIEDESLPIIALGRQVPKADLEFHLVNAFADDYGMGRLDVGLSTEHYFSGNPSKESLVKFCILNDGSLKERLVAHPQNLDVFKGIKTDSGSNLPEYHQQLRAKAKVRTYDLSATYSNILEQSLSNGHAHEIIWTVEDGRAKKYSWNERKRAYENKRDQKTLDEIINCASNNDARPDANWYYKNIYMLLPGILIPNLAFAVTPWENDDEKIFQLADESYWFAEKLTGRCPLTIPICNIDYLERLRVCDNNSIILEHPSEIKFFNLTGDFYDDTKEIGRSLVRYVAGRVGEKPVLYA